MSSTAAIDEGLDGWSFRKPHRDLYTGQAPWTLPGDTACATGVSVFVTAGTWP
jgi:hypothetical protein